MADSPTLPRLRPVEVFPAEQDGRQVLVVHDPSGLALGPIAVSPAALLILTMLDGEHTVRDVEAAFGEHFGQPLPAEQLESMIDQLDAAHYLDSERFQAFLHEQAEEYRSAPTRMSAEAGSLGADSDGLEATLRRLLAENQRIRPARAGSRIAGLVAPHLDFGRGQRCYADVYGLLAESAPPKRVVILGTNHFGQSASVVATTKDFETPLGIVRTDRTFLEELQTRCRCDLTRHELDHKREHSVELQVVLLQHVLGTGSFEIVPVLCPDPCGPTGTLPCDGRGVDLRVFADQLGEMVRSASEETLVVAGADLSHVGTRFGDPRDLDEPFLEEVRRMDGEKLDALLSGDAALFVGTVASRGNSTRICSAGCLYTMVRALPWAKPELLRYHQAVDADGGTGVTCASMVFWHE